MEGNLFGGEQIVLRSTGHVKGNLTAPRVSLEDGAQFKGAIDMEPKRSGGSSSSTSGGSSGGGRSGSGGSPEVTGTSSGSKSGSGSSSSGQERAAKAGG